jgi:hypothetical protein
MVLLRLRDLLARFGERAPAAGADFVATRAAWGPSQVVVRSARSPVTDDQPLFT